MSCHGVSQTGCVRFRWSSCSLPASLFMIMCSSGMPSALRIRCQRSSFYAGCSASLKTPPGTWALDAIAR